jgi:hypothetical protein
MEGSAAFDPVERRRDFGKFCFANARQNWRRDLSAAVPAETIPLNP